jgi:hypothetical protein
LAVSVNGKKASSLAPDAILKLPRRAVQNKEGDARDGIALEDLAQALGGKSARVVAIAAGAERVSISKADGRARTIVLRVTRRGEIKIQKLAGGGAVDTTLLKNVDAIELER